MNPTIPPSPHERTALALALGTAFENMFNCKMLDSPFDANTTSKIWFLLHTRHSYMLLTDEAYKAEFEEILKLTARRQEILNLGTTRPNVEIST